jgi:ERF superfamily protein
MADPKAVVVHEQTAPAQGFGAALMQMLADPNIPADKMQVVMQARKEILLEEGREQFNMAYARMAPDIPQVSKNGLVELVRGGQHVGSYRFARWEDMDTVLRPILAEHGFALAFSSKERPDGVLVIGELIYRGYSKTSDILLPPDAGPGRNALQAAGGALSYGKRYTAELLLNIVRKGEDTDAVGALDRKITAKQVSELSTLLAETATELQYFLKVMVSDATELADVRERDFVRLVNALNDRKRNQANKKSA